MYTNARIPQRIALAAALALASMAPRLVFGAADDAMAPADKDLAALYWQGHDALRKSDWSAALQRFAELERRMRTKDAQNADAAIYWEAYALTQAKRGTEAKAAVERLHHEFPASRWSKDADALLRKAEPALAQPNAPDDEALAEIAVEGLLNAPPERALPLLKKVLDGRHSSKIKKRALFVLSQLDDDAALATIVEVAKTNNDPALREEAVRMLGVSGEARAIERLRELYASAADAHEKRAIVQAWLTADRKDLILAAARTEPDANVRREAIQALGALDAAAELQQLFDTTHDEANQREIVQALGVAGNVQALVKIAGNASTEAIRIEAIRALGVSGDRGGNVALVDLYPKATTPALRDAVLQGLLIAGDTDAMLKLYRQAKTAEEKQALLRIITMTNSGAALDVIESELKD
ncbi:MAG TPA: HEAT repeat domain-containing protein [Rudaea sp.]|nr:HEAT repeat domain-containing protein [Rudaea sp.]